MCVTEPIFIRENTLDEKKVWILDELRYRYFIKHTDLLVKIHEEGIESLTAKELDTFRMLLKYFYNHPYTEEEMDKWLNRWGFEQYKKILAEEIK